MLLIFIGILLMPFAFMDKLVGKPTKKVIVWLFLILFLILGSIRWRTGTDWLPYQYGFEYADTYYNATQGPWSYEWGYSMLNYIVNIAFGSYTIFLFIFTFLKIFFKCKVLLSEKFVNYSLFTLFLYYCYMQGDILTSRQLLAISITLFSTIYIIHRRLYKFLICIVFASLIHRTAIIFVFAYFVYDKQIKQQTLLLWFFISMIIGLILFQVNVSAYFQNIPIVSNFSKFQEKIDVYAKAGQVVYGQIDTSTTIVLGYIKKLFVVLPMLLFFNAFEKNKIYRGMLNIFIVGSIIYFTLGAIAADFKRLNGYFEIYEILLIPFWVYNVKHQKFKYIILFFYVVYAFIRLSSSLFTFWDLIDPFYTIFDNITRQNLY